MERSCDNDVFDFDVFDVALSNTDADTADADTADLCWKEKEKAALLFGTRNKESENASTSIN